MQYERVPFVCTWRRREYSGAALMGAGLFCPRLPDCGSWVWHIGEADRKG